ncbi:hypothetical protein BDZ89DRAFT_437761 [Hymenopellis radicata]|nr:hypothetical protein BDZ89DRAFT_437761 [Hymenopellis radicata]
MTRLTLSRPPGTRYVLTRCAPSAPRPRLVRATLHANPALELLKLGLRPYLTSDYSGVSTSLGTLSSRRVLFPFGFAPVGATFLWTRRVANHRAFFRTTLVMRLQLRRRHPRKNMFWNTSWDTSHPRALRRR